MTLKNTKLIGFLTIIMVMAASGGIVSMAKAKSTKAKSVKTEQIATKSENEVELAANLAPGLDPSNTLILTLKDGEVTIKLRPDLAPKTVTRIKELVAKKFYDGLKFHRVIDGFMAQTGDPKGNGTGGSGVNVPAEFTNANFARGTLGMARANDPNSGDSQFFYLLCPGGFFRRQIYRLWRRRERYGICR